MHVRDPEMAKAKTKGVQVKRLEPGHALGLAR